MTKFAPLLVLLAGCTCTGEPTEKTTDLPPTPPAAPARHALLIVLDTLRADVLAEVDTPVLDALAQAGASMPRAWAPGTWTVPSTISLLTGMPVRQHGWDLPTGRLGRYPVFPAVDTVATVLKGNGFATAGWYANPYLAEELGFERGFDTWRRSVDGVMPGQFATAVQKEWRDGRRHFAYLHFIGGHSPLRPSEATRDKYDLDAQWFDERGGMNIGAAKRNKPAGARETYAKAYRAVVEDLDARVGEVLAALGDLRQETVVVVVSDHGELLGEHDVVGHGTQIWEGLTRVPLVVDHPHVPGEQETLPDTLTISSVPALLTEALGLEHRWPTAARPALPLVSEREGLFALSVDGQFKAIWQQDGSGPEVYDLVEDPAESRPLPDPGDLAAARAEWEAAVPAGDLAALREVDLLEEIKDELKTLGYRDPDEKP